MPEIVFEVVAVVFQDIEGLVFDFPSGSGAVGDLGDIGFVDREAGDEGPLIGDLAPGVGDGQCDPVDETGVIALAQGNIVEPSQMMPSQLAALDLTKGAFLGCGPSGEIMEGLVGGGLGGEQKIPPAWIMASAIG